MRPVRLPSLLDQIRAAFAARGWDPNDLGTFRMEGEGGAGAGGEGGQGGGAGAGQGAGGTGPQPDLAALQRSIDEAKAAGTTEATSSLLKALGFDKLEDAQTWVTAKRDAERAGMDEATRLKAEAEDARKAADAEKAEAEKDRAKSAKAEFDANLRAFLVECGVAPKTLADTAVLVSAELGFATDAKAEDVVAATAKVRERQASLFTPSEPDPKDPPRAPGNGLPKPPAGGGAAKTGVEAGRERAKAALAARQGSTAADLLAEFGPKTSPLAPTPPA